jgi:hypothetical protein
MQLSIIEKCFAEYPSNIISKELHIGHEKSSR